MIYYLIISYKLLVYLFISLFIYTRMYNYHKLITYNYINYINTGTLYIILIEYAISKISYDDQLDQITIQ